MHETAKSTLKQKVFWGIPVAVFIILCFSEWVMWVYSPDAFFFPRGRIGRQLNYSSTIHGDLSTGNIFVTPCYRKFHFRTDDFSVRNNISVDHADIMILGQSFAAGGGSSQEFMPASQLARMTGKVVVNSAEREVWMPGYDQYQAAAFILKFNKPISTKVLIFDIVDSSLTESLSGETIAQKVQDIIANAADYPVLSIGERFQKIKKHIKDYSPQAIIARKMKTVIKTKFLMILYKLKLFKRMSRTLDYIDHDGKVYALPKVNERFTDNSLNDNTLNQNVDALVLLNRFAQKQKIAFIVTITPSKVVAYNRFVDTPYKIQGFGPAQMLYDRLKEHGVQTVMFHPEILKAVEEQMTHNGPFVYWGDDTHWGPYGIEMGMKKVAQKLSELKGILPSLQLKQ